MTYWRDEEPVIHEYAYADDLPRISSVAIADQGTADRPVNCMVRTLCYDENNRQTSVSVSETKSSGGVQTTAVETHATAYGTEAVSAVSSDSYTYHGATVTKSYTWDSDGQHVTAVDNDFGGR